MRHRELARAKLNLFLHVTGRRADGYHNLQSLVVFPRFGDLLSFEPAEEVSLQVSGPFGDACPADAGNLALRAARAVLGEKAGVAMTLEKNLPVAAGIGGGSADAAAVLRWAGAASRDLALSLGADVPVCVAETPGVMSGIGEVFAPLSALPGFWVVLVNDGVPVVTADVFGALGAVPARAAVEVPDGFASLEALVAFLGRVGNDLQDPAMARQPGIAAVLAGIGGAKGCAFAAMSGSGGTCFGLFAEAAAAREAARSLHRSFGWWAVAAEVEAVSGGV